MRTPKDSKIIMYITANEKQAIEQQAMKEKRSTSDYCRMVMMEKVRDKK